MHTITPDVDRAILDLMDSVKTLGSQRPTFAAAMHALTAAILAYGDARAAEERKRAVNIAALVFVRDPYALHPDIDFDALNESARTAAHSIAQTIAGLIADG